MSTQSFFFRAVDHVAPPRNWRIAVAATVAIVLLVLQTGLGQSVLKAVGFSRPTEPFVELYFPNARTLPSTLPASDHLNIRFAMSNVGPTTHAFAWQVSEKTGDAPLGLASGNSVVPANRTDVVVQRIRVYCSARRVQVLISIEHTSARITLWLACPSSR
jgi:hypothetical protein